MVAFCKRLAENAWFSKFIVAVIVFNAIVMGLETSSTLMESYGQLLIGLNWAVQAIFIAELLIRITAKFPKPANFFKDGWNVFDFTVVVVSLLPAAGPIATLARVARLLRVARLISAFPVLRLIIETMLRSIPSLFHVLVLMSLLLYIYGVLGYHLFSQIDPAHWGSLGRSLLTLFQILTLENWSEIQGNVMAAKPHAWIYFLSFIVIAVFVVVNLFIAVVINNLQEVKAEEAHGGTGPDEVLADLQRIKDDLAKLEHHLRESRSR